VDEFSLINKYFDWDQGIGDDCALISIDHGKQLATTVDTLIEGVPLLVSPPTKEILYCLASALSDWEKSASHFLSTLGKLSAKVKIVTKKKIFDLDPGKLYFINKRVKLRENKYFLNLRKNNECSK
jgi:hypothetical protein